jgi:hypothetical protein
MPIQIPSLVSDQVYTLDYEVIDLTKGRYSHSFYGEVREGYPLAMLQPRQASLARLFYLSKIYDHFDAWQFLAEFHQLSLGTPIFIADYAAVGNGRCAILAHAYWQKGWQARNYVAMLVERAEELGLTMPLEYEQPMLIRRVLSPIDVVLFVNEANMRLNQSYSKDEWAAVDAHFISGDLLLTLDVRESPEKTFMAQANMRFVSAWIGKLPESERVTILDARTHTIDLAGVARLERALLARVYGSNWLTMLTYDSYDTDIRSVTNALRWSVVKVAQVEELVKQGRRPSDAAIAKDILAAVQLWQIFKKSNVKSIEFFLQQGGLFEDPNETQQTILKMFEANRRSGTKIKERIDDYCDSILAMSDTQQGSLF